MKQLQRLRNRSQSYAIALLCCLIQLISLPAIADEQIIAPDGNAELQQSLIEAWQAQGADYKPRTHHLHSDGSPKYINRLMLEASPYLKQHAHNPVNWYAWGEEAFEKARAEKKPVFLSIGYSTCHWCHVMERESFENIDIAEIMNEQFVNIKVDREQLPDVDALYMTAVQMITGRGGWPMSSFLDAKGRPFFGGTYFPPAQFTDLLGRVIDAWQNQNDTLMSEADNIEQALNASQQLIEQSSTVGREDIHAATQQLLANFDSVKGGFGAAPKFPQESSLLFLLEQARDHSDKEALDAVDYTLQRMAAGGIHDQIGGGFHRYSVDDIWLVPHFEKMLYNQAGLARAYTLANQLTGLKAHEETARGILDYVMREMTSSNGLFYSATDADSEGREGAFFVWTPEQLEDALGEADAQVAKILWGIDDFGNFEGESILVQPMEPDLLARRLDMPLEVMLQRKAEIAGKLLAARNKREAPLLDNKALTGWNGMMIAAFAQAGVAFDEPEYVAAAVSSAQTLWSTAWSESNGLLRSRYKGATTLPARQTDYAWLADGYIELYDATGDTLWLDRAVLLMKEMDERFAAIDGGYFLGADDVQGAPMLVRPRDTYDASTPSGNGVALSVYARLFERTGESEFQDIATSLVAAFSGLISERRGGLSAMLSGLGIFLGDDRAATQYAGRGKAKVSAIADADQRVQVTIELDEGWHINSSEPLQDYLIGTALNDTSGNSLSDPIYPAATVRELEFQSEALALYEHEVNLSAQLPEKRNPLGQADISVRLQVCSDKVCLAPETLTLSVLTE